MKFGNYYCYYSKKRGLHQASINIGKSKGRNFEISGLFAWYDLWIGIYADKKNSTAYILPIPCLGIKVRTYVYQPWPDLRIEDNWKKYDNARQIAELTATKLSLEERIEILKDKS